MDIKQTLIDLFKTHPTIDTFYMTSDGQFFQQLNNANYQASKLKDKGVATVTRDKVQPLIDAAAPAAPDPSLGHPEQTTVLTAEELQAKAADDASATAALDNLIGAAPAAPAAEPAAGPVVAPAAEPVTEPAVEPATESAPAVEPAAETEAAPETTEAEPAAETDAEVDAEIAEDQTEVSAAQAKLDAALNKKTKPNAQQ